MREYLQKQAFSCAKMCDKQLQAKFHVSNLREGKAKNSGLNLDSLYQNHWKLSSEVVFFPGN